MALLLTKRRRIAAVTATVVAVAAVATAGLLANMDDNEPHYRGYLERIGGEEEEEGTASKASSATPNPNPPRS